MRKQTKVAVVVSAAALLAMGASMTSFAKGWTLEDNEWVYLDSDDERIYGDWKKSVDGNYYWLDEETGVMATNRLVEDEDATYYVNEDGVRVVNDWRAVANEDGETINGVEVENLWYYFGSNGKAHKAQNDLTKKTIGGKTYFFDANGYMQNGWIEYDGETYYCGTEEQGYAYTGWQYLETETENCPAVGDYEDEVWFYFSSGKMVSGKTKYIDGHYYSFDENGVMETGWEGVTIASGADGITATGAQAYAASNGVMNSGWVKATPEGEDDAAWFYMVTVRDKGDNVYRAVPFNSGATKYRAKSINGKTFMFDTEGKMLTGLKDLTNEQVAGENDKYDGITYKAMDRGIYFFEKDGANKGAMKTGKVTVTEDGEDYTYYFDKTTGMALTETLKDGSIYGPDGVRLEAQDGNNYEIVKLGFEVKDAKDPSKKIPVDSQVVVSASGKIRTSGTVKIDGESYTVKFDLAKGEFSVTPKN